ncbi:hypothetical protein V2G26_006417 [Clonostachys chloroleuca]
MKGAIRQHQICGHKLQKRKPRLSKPEELTPLNVTNSKKEEEEESLYQLETGPHQKCLKKNAPRGKKKESKGRRKSKVPGIRLSERVRGKKARSGRGHGRASTWTPASAGTRAGTRL